MSAGRTTNLLAFTAALSILSPALSALETDWLELKEGHEGQKIHAKVNRIQLPELGSKGGQHVTVSIPKDALESTDKIQEVVVVGKRGDNEVVLSSTHYEWSEDYESDNYGLIITLDKMENYPIRVYLKSNLPLSENQ